jgi:catechol 2,3-dioxygenase-like lactoylglutathione lyase family enzyme
MGTRILILFVVTLSTLLFAGNPQSKEDGDMTTVRVRYMVNDLDPAVEFYTKHLGFHVKQERRPNFAMLSRGNLELVLSTPFGPGGAAKPMPDGRKPEPGGWNRIILNVDDLPAPQGTIAFPQ